MGTRSKKFKYSIFTKLLCWLITICSFCCCFSILFEIGLNCYVLGPEKYFKQSKVSFFETEGFLKTLQEDFWYCGYLSQNNSQALQQALQTEKEALVSATLNTFLDYKAGLIKAELEYAVENWDDSYHMYDDTVDVTIPEDYTQVYVNTDEPKSVQTAKKILFNAEGREFLNYEGLVRTDAFASSHPTSEKVAIEVEGSQYEFIFYIDTPLSYNEVQAKKYIADSYNDFVYQCIEQEFSVPLEMLQRLDNRVNLKYYVVDLDGDVYSNIESIPQNLKNNERYILANKENHEVKGFVISDTFEEYLENNGSKMNVLCMYFDEAFSGDDIYGRMYITYNNAQSNSIERVIGAFLALLVLAVAMLIVWLKLIGKKANSDTVNLIFIDKIPTDIHLLASGSIVFAILVCLHDVLNFGTEYFHSLIFTEDFKIILAAALAILLLLGTEWLSSVVRIKKARESFFKRTLIFMLLKKACQGIVFVARKVKRLFDYRPQVFKWQFIVGCISFFLINALLCLFITFAEWFTGFDGVFTLLIGLVLLVFDLVVCFFAVKFINNLDKVIVASGERKKISFGKERVGKALHTLANNLDGYNDALLDAVAKAVKNEQMKTQLITNVSHDLKTPLTSLINYSDLLSKCNITDEKAMEYIDVINSQSVKLKRLIEDLIEASKTSTGNVQLNKTSINLSELAVQAIVEFSAELESNRIEVKFSEPEEAPIVFADSIKTYRIISNLFSNAKKYSAPNTRVYVRVYDEGDFGCFEMKNISKEPLNISPELLTERFVRGDESRTNEGNGLGLSIAEDLCKLQGGSLNIVIDGDLFKVTVKLPKN